MKQEYKEVQVHAICSDGRLTQFTKFSVKIPSQNHPMSDVYMSINEGMDLLCIEVLRFRPFFPTKAPGADRKQKLYNGVMGPEKTQG